MPAFPGCPPPAPGPPHGGLFHPFDGRFRCSRRFRRGLLDRLDLHPGYGQVELFARRHDPKTTRLSDTPSAFEALPFSSSRFQFDQPAHRHVAQDQHAVHPPRDVALTNLRRRFDARQVGRPP